MSEAKEKLQKHTFFFFEGDVAKLADLYPHLPVSQIIRNLIRTHILNVEKATEAVKTNKLKVNINV